MVVVWRSGSTLVSINEVNLRRARLVLGWVAMSGSNSRCRSFISVCNQPTWSTQPGHPFVGRRNEYQSKAMMPCAWGIKAGMVRVWVAGTRDPFVTHGPYLSASKIRHYKALYKFIFFTFYCFYFQWCTTRSHGEVINIQ